MKFIQLLLTCFAAALSFSAEANHILGGDFRYEYVGEFVPGFNRYRFTLTLFRSCAGSGADFDKPAYFAVYVGTETQNQRISEFCVAGTSNPCKDGSYQQGAIIGANPGCTLDLPATTCVEYAEYVFERDLPAAPDASYYVVYQRCCRVGGITNIVESKDLGSTYAVTITPEAQVLRNSSPRRVGVPPVYAAANLPFAYRYQAIDADGDSLTYRLCTPWLGGGSLLSPQAVLFSCEGAAPRPPCGPPFDTLPFAAPWYTPSSPMGGAPPVVMAADGSGVFSGVPVGIGRYLVTVCVEEYRNGVLLSSSRWEWTYSVVDCFAVGDDQPSVATDAGVVVTPNPTTGALWVGLRGGEALRSTAIFELFDQQGRLVLTQQLAAGVTAEAVDLQGLAPGLYHWRFTADAVSASGRVVISG